MDEKIKELIQHYVTFLLEDPSNKYEVYKWQAIKHFQQHWNIEASNFYEMFKEAFRKRGNLVYQNSFSFLDALGKYFPEQLRSLFLIVYGADDFYTKLDKAKTFVENNIGKLRKKLDKENFNHQFDERTLSFLLTMQNPNEETFYKSTLYIQLCKYLGITSQKEGKYKHYIALLFQIIPFLNDPKLNSLKVKFVPQGEDIPLLLAQDIVYQNMNKNTKHYWLYSPGEQAIMWDEFYDEGIMAIGWDELEDLENYTDRKSILEALIDNYGGGEDQRNNVSAIDDFCNGENKINIGDMVIVKKGTKTLLGYGCVTSDYYYDENREEFLHCREVEWLKKGEWNLDFTLPRKTLTDVTSYDSDIEGIKYAQYLLNIMNENIQTQENDLITKLLKYKPQIILQGPPGTGKTREAKRIAKALLGLGENDSLEGNEQFKLIQFHPSYSYEDFVRGIVAMPNEEGDGIIYTAENKVLAEFANRAQKSLQECLKRQSKSINWEDFRDFLQKKKEKNKEVYFSDKVKLDRIENYKDGHSALYFLVKKNEDWMPNEAMIHFSNFSQENLDDNFENFYTNYDRGYWESITNYFINWFKQPEPFVLIIDEINRANLSAVLGELIYALEYRGEAVQSMYAIEGENNLILPPNLYIIGTMNTADRSVGHIDYAIRRRFAFVNVLPKELEKDFDRNLFKAVSKLFIDNYDEYINNPDIELKRAKTLSPEFRPEDVWLGHSYFITKNTPIDIRWEYEIKPILLEYVKDGILIGEGIETTINNLINDENNAS
ncbi:hypothetical protein HMPREF1551_02593 [Capnocytophaga sp. oral taxon 863 str. F0517]|uniref:McrB family protein n=1 Tax=Capnocytophaga sp. oral taxon 863 TaxID=1227265 RepID=UPI0003980DCC|nr:AAA family ATPase [Capnocytophaga sp. oral taxon 863]ERI61582.1 hypothetical protein HMPREF1551_02593 [Capnocytophaga sp. oral taxon 863 str. F0517]